MARAAIPVAIEATNAASPGVRITGARVIELVAYHARDGLPAVARLLADPVTAVRVAALEALCECGANASPYRDAVAALVTRGETEEERLSATDALANIDTVE